MADLNDPGFWRRFWSRLTGRPRLDQGDKAYPFDQHQTPSGTSVNSETALRLSAVWACVRLRSQTMATLPLHLRSADRSPALDHPLYRVLHTQPNADMTASEYWEAKYASLDLWGNAYSRIDREGRRIVALTPMDPERVIVGRQSSGRLEYEYKRNGRTETFDESEVFHLKGFTLDGMIGLSTLQYIAEMAGNLMDANRAASHEFANNLKMGGFLKTGMATLTGEQRERLRAQLAMFGLPENAGKWMVLEAGVEPATAQSIRMKPEDAQLLESRYFGIEEICRGFGVPPQLIGHTNKASSWASSLENTNMGFLTYTLRPALVRTEQAIAKSLLTPEERHIYRPKYSVEGLLRADSAGRSALHSTYVQNGIMTRNEVRALEDLPPIPGGDELTVQVNMTPIDRLGRSEDTTP